MRRGIVAVAVCAVVVALGAAPASASIADESVNVCSGKAKWQLTFNPTGTSTASVDITSSNCKTVNAHVEDDGDFGVGSSDSVYTSAGTPQPMIGVTVTGSRSFVGVMTRDWMQGPVEAVHGSILNATLTGVNPATGETSTEEHVGTGSCGTNCYTTDVVWTTQF